jgi:hypothetical protein
MKKLLVTIALMGAVAYTYGQGVVAMGNSSALASWKSSASATAELVPATATPSFRYAAFYAPDTSTVVPFTGDNWTATVNSLAGWTQLQQGVNNAATAGRISWTAATPTLPAPYAAGSKVSLFVTAWQDPGTLATWDLAKSAAMTVGSSEYIKVVAGGGFFPTPSIWGADDAANGLFASTPIVLQTLVPEPTSFALLGLGAAGLLIFRRRS